MQGCTQTTCPYCGVGCGVEVKQQEMVGDVTHPANQGALCVKGAALAESLRMPTRLLYPQLSGQQVSWSHASEWIAEQFFQAMQQHGADSVAMYVSGQLLTEDYYVANKLMKGYVGSANIDTNSRLCMSSAVAAHVRAFGEDVVPVSYDDLEHAELIVICGANTAWTHPVLFRRIQQVRERKPNVKLVVIDPRKTVTAEQADLHLALANDSDVALFNGLLRYAIDQQKLDDAFIEAHTQGFKALLEVVMQEKYQLPDVASRCGLSIEALSTFYRWFVTSQASMTLFCQGVNQAQNGVDKGNAIINAHLATGQIGERGAGPFSLTGQPNAMGGREVGGLANQLAVHRGFDPNSIHAVHQFWQSPRIAEKPGLKAVELFDALARGEIKVLWIIATNPVVSMPDNQAVREALADCPCVIVSDITADSDVAQYADLLLPAAGWGEKQGMVTNSERRLSRQRRFLSPPGEAKADWQAVCDVGSLLCAKLGAKDGFAFDSEAAVFREFAALSGINRDSPLKFDLSAYQTMSDEDYQNWAPTQWGGESPYRNKQFSYPDGKARFIAVEQGATGTNVENQAGLWWLNTGRQRDQWHTMTRTGHIEKLSGSEVEPTVYLNALSAQRLEVTNGEFLSLRHAERDHALLAKVAVDESLSLGQLFMSMHWAGVYAGGSQVNAAVCAEVDPISGQPAFKSSLVRASKANIATFGLYIGKNPPPVTSAYRAYQHQDKVGIWRFASEEPISLEVLSRSNSKYVTWQLPQGWIGIEIAAESLSTGLTEGKVESILLSSPTPLNADYQALSVLIGQPVQWQALMQAAFATRVSQLVCSCLRVTDVQIEQAIAKQGVSNLVQLQSQLKCGTNCGSCVPQLKQFFN